MTQSSVSTVIDFSSYIAERTQSFTGRRQLFEKLNSWLADSHGGRFFLITGEPGSGKTAIASRLHQFSTGQVTSPADLPELAPGFLGASHFCSARDRDWINPLTLAASLATQLANRYSAFAEALKSSSEAKQVNINVQQQAQSVSGRMVGVWYEVHIGGPSAEDAFQSAVRRPLQALFASGHQQPVIILVDSLDEALLYSGPVGIVSLLVQSAYLPDRVRFILTSRPRSDPDPVLRAPLQRDGMLEWSLTSGEGLRYSLSDVHQYVLETLSFKPELGGKLATDLTAADFATAVSEKSEDGNFLYVTYLLQMLLKQPEPITKAALSILPAGLDGIYQEFLGRLVGQDHTIWTQRYAPIVGTLAVAQAGLTEQQLASIVGDRPAQVSVVLEGLIQFLDADNQALPSQRTYTLYHRSFAEFLLDRDRAGPYWCAVQEQHERIIRHYRGPGISLKEVNWEQVDNYGLQYLAAHLYALIQRGFEAYRQELYAMISRPLMREKLARYDSHLSFATDVGLAIEAAGSEAPPNLVQLVRACCIYATLAVCRREPC